LFLPLTTPWGLDYKVLPTTITNYSRMFACCIQKT